MKNIKIIFILFLCFFCFTTVNAEEEKQVFYFDWENDLVEDINDYAMIASDNFAYKDGAVIIRTIVDSESNSPNIELELRDIEGKVIAENIIENIAFFSGITDDKHIYIVVQKNNSTEVEATANASPNQFILKIDDELEVVDSIEFDTEYTPGVDGMMTARIFGHDILAIEDEKLYVFCGEEYMLNTSLDLEEWDTMEYSKTKFAKYFPDLSTEYDLMEKWMNELQNNPTSDVDILVTTHVYPEFILSSGAKFLIEETRKAISIPLIGLIKITDNQGKVIFEEINENYAKFIEARVIGDYVVAIGLNESSIMGNSNASELGNDIVVYNMDGDVVQVIETKGSYLFLNETANGFVTTHIEVCPVQPQPQSAEPMSIELAEEAQVEYEPCGYNTEAYYLPLNIDTKVTGSGSVSVIRTSRKGANVKFEIQPEPGYVLDTVKVTDAKGNVLTFTDYSFTMPSADVTIEANFLPENPSTFDGIFGSIVIAIVSMTCALGFTILLNNVRKEKNI